MLDIKFIKEHPQLVKDAARKKHLNVDVDLLLSLDEQRLSLLREIESLRSEQNKESNLIASAQSEVEKVQRIEEVSKIKEELKKKEDAYKDIVVPWQKLMYAIPNIPDMSVPEGFSDEDNVVIKTWGNMPTLDFEAKSHIDIMEALDLVDFKRGSKVHGFRGYYLKNDAVLLSFAIWQYALNFFAQKGFNPMIAPAIVKEEYLYGTGHLPNDAEDV